jgi:MFS family permease
MGISHADERAYLANVWKTYAFAFFMNFQFWHSIWVLYLRDYRGFSLTQITLLDVPFWLLIVLFEVPSGAFADRFGRRTSLALSSGFFSAAILIFGLSGNYLVILFSYSLWALSLTFMSGADSALLFDSLKMVGREEEFAKVSGRVWAVMAAGALGGTVTGGPMAEATNLAFPVAVSSVVAAMAMVMALLMREPPLHAGERVRYVDLFRDARDIVWQRPAVRSFMGVATIIGVASFAPAVFFQQPFLDRHGVAVRNFGFVQAPNLIAGAATALLAYRIAGVAGKRGVYVWMAGALVAMFALLGTADTVWAFAAFPAVVGIRNLLQPLAADYLNQRVPSSHRATVLSVRSLLFSLAIAPAEPLLGLVADHMSLLAVFRISALALAVLAPPLLVWWLRADAREPLPAEAAAEAEGGVTLAGETAGGSAG